MMEAAPPVASPPARKLRPALELALASGLHLLLLVALVQAWLAGWPGRWWLAAAVLVALPLSATLWRRARTAPLLVGGAAAAWLFLFPAVRYGSGGGGLLIAGLSFDAAASILLVAALAAAAWQAALLPRLPRAVRFAPAGLALYAGAGIAVGAFRDAPLGATLAGGGWLPFWLHGPYLGAGVLLPAGILLSAGMLTVGLVRRGDVARPAVVLALLAVAFLLTGLELTRQGRPNLAAAFLPATAAGEGAALAAADGSTAPAAKSVPDPAPELASALAPGEEWLAAFGGETLDEIFARVATGVRYEPYPGILRGAVGTAVARSGNSADQAMLLADRLRSAGYRVRLVRGRLGDDNVTAVIRGMYPPRVRSWAIGPEYAPYDPAADDALREVVRPHLWVEVFQGAEWLPLDPSFPRARIGEAYAEAEEHFDEPAPELFQRVAVKLKEETGDGKVRDLGRFEGTVAELGLRPISLVVRAIPQAAAAPEAAMGSPGGMLGGMGSALGGGSAEKEPAAPAAPAKIVGVAYRRALEVAGAAQKVEPTVVMNGDARGALRREWLEFTLTAPGEAPRAVERDLFRADGSTPTPAEARRYTINLVPGRVHHAYAAAQAARAGGAIDLRALKGRARSLSRVGPDDPQAAGAALELGRMDDAAGTLAGHLLTLRFAAESDSLTRLIADRNGVALAWATPRILIAGVETTQGKKNRLDAKVSIDLRLDEVRAYPYPGAPARMAPVFQAARGMQESVLEGALVALASGQEAASANTARLVSQAEAEGIPLLVIGAGTRTALDQLDGPSPACRARIENAIDRGREVVVPMRAVRLAGAPRWGWWEVNPASGEIIGVMEDGEHQGMVEYELAGERIALNDESGKVIGLIMGATTTQFTLAALLLEHGSVTPQLIAALEAHIGRTLCLSCPQAEAKLEVGVGASIEHDCFSISRSESREVGVSGSIKFCEEYSKGFKCAAGLIVRGLKGEGLAQVSLDGGIDGGFSGQLNCEEF
ncbi:MAG TPA: transglutaminase family protein [Longimicrobiaceae bacterium]|nr:transglutaminase family protein [Longimicrobiaceae bacterium]